jgi:hypothetical protein
MMQADLLDYVVHVLDDHHDTGGKQEKHYDREDLQGGSPERDARYGKRDDERHH